MTTSQLIGGVWRKVRILRTKVWESVPLWNGPLSERVPVRLIRAAMGDFVAGQGRQHFCGRPVPPPGCTRWQVGIVPK
jgi:hypothetical protein